MKLTSRFALVGTVGAVVAILNSISFAENGGAKNSSAFDKKDIPAVVSAAFQKAYPKAKVTSADKEMKEGKTFYEIESTDGKIERNILYTAEGVTYEIEEGIEPGRLPALVKTSVEKEYPKGKIEKSEKIMRGEILEYELLIASGEKRIELVFDAGGHVIRSSIATTGNDEDDEEGEEQED